MTTEKPDKAPDLFPRAPWPLRADLARFERWRGAWARLRRRLERKGVPYQAGEGPPPPEKVVLRGEDVRAVREAIDFATAAGWELPVLRRVEARLEAATEAARSRAGDAGLREAAHLLGWRDGTATGSDWREVAYTFASEAIHAERRHGGCPDGATLERILERVAQPTPNTVTTVRRALLELRPEIRKELEAAERAFQEANARHGGGLTPPRELEDLRLLLRGLKLLPSRPGRRPRA